MMSTTTCVLERIWILLLPCANIYFPGLYLIINIDTPDLFYLVLRWYTFFHSFTFTVSLALYLSGYRHCTVESCYFLYSVTIMLFIWSLIIYV